MLAQERQGDPDVVHGERRTAGRIDADRLRDPIGPSEPRGNHALGPLPGRVRPGRGARCRRSPADTPSSSSSSSSSTPSASPETVEVREATLVVTVTVGSMIARARASSPRTLAPASITSASVSARSGEDRLRNADQIVVVGRSRVDPVPGAQHRGAHLLGAGLPVGSADRDHRTGDRSPPGTGELAIRIECVGHPVRQESGDVPVPATLPHRSRPPPGPWRDDRARRTAHP